MLNPSPLRYPGGKFKLYKFVKEMVNINNCSTYIEPFAGGSALTFALLFDKHVKKVKINDYDYSIFCFWYSVLNRTTELVNLIIETPVTIEEWYNQKFIRENMYNYDPIIVAFSTFFLNRVNRSGIIDKAGPIGGLKQNGNYLIDCRFNRDKLVNKIIMISKYKDAIQLTNLDALEFIEQEISGTRNSFTFFDPPYYTKGRELYTNFYNHGDHENLSKAIITLLKNRKWIVTYDIAKDIKEFYSKSEFITFNLTYTLQVKKSVSEYMFFSKSLERIQDERNYINIFDSSHQLELDGVLV